MRSGVEARRIAVEGKVVDAFVFAYSARRMLLAGLVCALFVLVGVAMLFSGDGEQRFWGGACVLLFGVGTVLAGASVRRPGFVALTREGIAAESRFGRMFTPWNAVIGVDRTWIGRSEMIVVYVSDPAQIRTTRGIGWLKALNATVRLPDLSFPTWMLGSAARLLEAGVRLYAGDPDRRERIGKVDELRALTEQADPNGAASVRRRAWQAPRVATGILWVIGVGGLLLSALALMDLSDAERPASRLLGAGVFICVCGAATASAWLLGRRPGAGRIVGLLAAAGLLFLGWILTTSPRATGTTVILGLVLIAAGALIGWQLFRWRIPQLGVGHAGN